MFLSGSFVSTNLTNQVDRVRVEHMWFSQKTAANIKTKWLLGTAGN